MDEFILLCEENYRLMALLLNDLNETSNEEMLSDVFIASNLESSTQIKLPLKVIMLEQSKFTSRMGLNIQLTDHHWVSPVYLEVRMYHDAALLEVLETGRQHAPQSAHLYPDQVDFYPDDKQQRNLWLNKLLKSCVQSKNDQVICSIMTRLMD